MKTLKHRHLLTAAALLALATAPAEAQTSTYDSAKEGYPLLRSVAADDTSVAFVLRYVGSEVSSKVAITGNAITLTDGAAGAEAADTSFECPLSAPFAGVVDLTNAACDTAGELIDLVNSTSGSQWRAYPVSALRSDFLYSTNQKILDKTAAVANGPNGVQVFWDTSTALHQDAVLGLVTWETYADFFDSSHKLIPNPFERRFVEFVTADALATFTGADAFQVYWVKREGNPLTNKYVETVTTLFGPRVDLATTVLTNFQPVSGFGLKAPPDGFLLVRASAATTFGTSSIHAVGKSYKIR